MLKSNWQTILCSVFFIFMTRISLASDLRLLIHEVQIQTGEWREIFHADLDGDGDVDRVAAGTTITDEISWFENLGENNFVYHPIDRRVRGARSVYAVDLNQDGFMDVLGTAMEDRRILWYENNGTQDFIRHTIADGVVAAEMIFAADYDRDGDLDIFVAAASMEGFWYENDGAEHFIKRDLTAARSAKLSPPPLSEDTPHFPTPPAEMIPEHP